MSKQQIQATNMVLNGTGNAPMTPGVWIGDPPIENPWGQPQVVPLPYIQPNVPNLLGPSNRIVISGNFPALQLSWRTDYRSDHMILSVDVPGVKAEDVNLEVADGTIKVSARRFDTHAFVSHEYVLTPSYDPKTVEATLDAGVLTVTVQRAKESIARRVPVRAK